MYADYFFRGLVLNIFFVVFILAISHMLQAVAMTRMVASTLDANVHVMENVSNKTIPTKVIKRYRR